MFFKNIRAYKINQDFVDIHKVVLQDKTALNDIMEENSFEHCTPMQLQSHGWVEPLPEASVDGSIDYIVNHAGCTIMCLKVETKVLPAKAVNEQTDKKANALAEKEGRKVSRKEKLQIKDDVIAEYLPKSLTVSKLIYAYIDWKNGLIIINSSSSKDAEMLINVMRDSLDSFPVVPIHGLMMFHQVVGAWVVSNQIPHSEFTFSSDIELANMSEPSDKVKFIQHGDNRQAAELIGHGFVVTKLSLQYKDIATFTLDKELAIKKVSMLDLSDKGLEEIDDAAAYWLAEFHIQSAFFGDLIGSILKAFEPF